LPYFILHLVLHRINVAFKRVLCVDFLFCNLVLLRELFRLLQHSFLQINDS
jgi:hypothetical protein